MDSWWYCINFYDGCGEETWYITEINYVLFIYIAHPVKIYSPNLFDFWMESSSLKFMSCVPIFIIIPIMIKMSH